MATEFRTTDREQKFVDFANFCTREKLEPRDVIEMMRLATRAFKAGEDYANTGSREDSRRNNRTSRRFEEKATTLGYSVSWPGLWPSLSKGGYDVHLPSMS